MDPRKYIDKRASLAKRHKGHPDVLPNVTTHVSLNSDPSDEIVMPSDKISLWIFDQSFLYRLPVFSYKDWKDIPTSAQVGYTKHANGSVSYTSDDETQLFLMIREKAEHVLEIYREFIYPNSKIYMLRSASKYAARGLIRGEFMAYADSMNGCIYLEASSMIRLSDIELYDTILHEISHVVHRKTHHAGQSLSNDIYESHGAAWYLIFTKMGGSGFIGSPNIDTRMHPMRDDVESPDKKCVFICTNDGPDGRCYDPVSNIKGVWQRSEWMNGTKLTPDERIITGRRCLVHNKPYELIVPENFRDKHPDITSRDVPLEYALSVAKRVSEYEKSTYEALANEPDKYAVIKRCMNSTTADGKCVTHCSLAQFSNAHLRVDVIDNKIIERNDVCMDHGEPFEIVVPHSFRAAHPEEEDDVVLQKYILLGLSSSSSS